MQRPIQYVVLCICLLSLASSFSCSPKPDCGVCPIDTLCRAVTGSNGSQNFVCTRQIRQSTLGGTCLGVNTNCQSNICHTPGSNKAISYCSKLCETDVDCTQGFKCTKSGSAKLCLRETLPGKAPEGCKCGKEGSSCTKNGHTDCAVDEGYFCLSSKPQDPNAKCTKPCDPNDASTCPKDLVCAATTLGSYLCIESPFPKGGLGGSCSKGGKAQCSDDEFCYTRWPNDAQAFCAKYCNPYQGDDCPDGFVCDSPRQRDPYLCIPKGKGKVGDDCTARDVLDCGTGICAQLNPRDREEKPFCTQTCEPTKADCPAGFKCRLFGHLYRFLCAKAGDGGIGSICNKNGDADCKSKLCIQPDPNSINKICTEACDGSQPCPDGFTCDVKRKLCIPATGKKKIGDPCTGPQECVFGTCVTDSAGKQFCTQQCTNDKQCPGGYQCRNLEFTQLYCLPKQAGDKKVGEPCPNGPGDCESNKCISDFIKNRTFCTESCDAKRPCDAPYVCTKISDREAYCTPKDYEAP